MTLTEQIATYAGDTSSYSSSIVQFLDDGVKDTVNTIVLSNPDEAPSFTGTSTLNASTTKLLLSDTDYVVDVRRWSTATDEVQFRRCDRIKPHIVNELENTDSIYFTTISSPVYYILNQELNVFPTPTNTEYVEVAHIKYGTVDDAGSAIGNTRVTVEDITSDLPATGTGFVFTAASHGLTDGDKVTVTVAAVLDELIGTVQIVTDIDGGTFTLDGIVSSNGTDQETSMTVVKEGTGFPTKFIPQVVRYASLRLLTQKAHEIRTNLPTLVLPVMPPEPDSPSFTYNNVEVESVVQPILDIADMADLDQNAPVYTPPVATPDFDAVQDFIDDEDPELTTAQLGKVTSQLQEYNMNIQSALNEFNEDNVKYQEDIQRKMQNFQKDMQEAVAIVQNEITVNTGNMNKDLQIDLQNKVQSFLKEVQEYGSELQRYGSLVSG